MSSLKGQKKVGFFFWEISTFLNNTYSEDHIHTTISTNKTFESPLQSTKEKRSKKLTGRPGCNQNIWSVSGFVSKGISVEAVGGEADVNTWTLCGHGRWSPLGESSHPTAIPASLPAQDTTSIHSPQLPIIFSAAVLKNQGWKFYSFS